MFSKLKEYEIFKYKPRKAVVICLGFLEISVLFSLGMYYSSLSHRIVKRQPPLRELSMFQKSAYFTEVHPIAPSRNIDHLQGYHDNKTENAPITINSKVASERSVTQSSLIMNGCPVDWPLEVIRHNSAGMPAAQVCRRTAGNKTSQWKCAKGWRSLPDDPYCIKNSTSSGVDFNTNSGKETFAPLEIKTRQFVAEKLNLLFHQLPGTSVEASPPVFRAAQENESLEKNVHDLYHKFTFIMHPCLRLINIWEEMSSSSVGNVSFRSFLNGRLPPWKPLLLFDEIRLKTQTEMLLGNRGRFTLDQILVLEKWDESLAELKKKADLGTNGFQFLRATSTNTKKCLSMFTEELWLKMKTSYAMDFCVLQYSTSINKTQFIPSLGLTMQQLKSRYHLCRQNVTKVNKSPLSNFTPPQFVSPNLCTIHTYYQPAFDKLQNIMENENVLREWEKAWVAAGWRTRVVNETDAKLHPDYQKLKERFQALPTINPEKYALCSFMRHVAMATVGGGWMSDYDTLPLNFPPCLKIPFNGSYTVWSGFVPALVSANANEYTRVAHLMADVGLQWRARPKFFIKSGWGVEVSDMRTLWVLVKEGYIKSFEVIIEKEDLSHGGFACNNSKRPLGKRNSENLPEGFSLLPLGVHLSHAFMRITKNRNITLWPGQSWGKETTSPSFRPTFMNYVHNIYLRKCNVLVSHGN
ncbi:hypothetical protein HOLleu_06865 [Holothuria leucospilota]|uniref:Uncharacterized protein n=1 Tax=Holothuria leucospilota TaxID=206669 RepID=A0A9Q1CLH3_HOLLE|nr:hypothetical protein HOLleu_06865 [Holothuria leucospilota]